MLPILPFSRADRQTASGEWAADMGEGLGGRLQIRQRSRDRANGTRAHRLDAKLSSGHALTRPYGPGMSARINPLDFGPVGDGWDALDRVEMQRRAGIIFRRWLTLIRGLVGSQFVGEQRVPFGPTDARVVEATLAHGLPAVDLRRPGAFRTFRVPGPFVGSRGRGRALLSTMLLVEADHR